MLGKDGQNATYSASHTIGITCSRIIHVQYTGSTGICNCAENLVTLVLWWINHVLQWHRFGASGYGDRAIAAGTVGLVSTKPFFMTLHICRNFLQLIFFPTYYDPFWIPAFQLLHLLGSSTSRQVHGVLARICSLPNSAWYSRLALHMCTKIHVVHGSWVLHQLTMFNCN